MLNKKNKHNLGAEPFGASLFFKNRTLRENVVQLLSSASITTIITLVMERSRTDVVRPRTNLKGPRCTGCTSSVPPETRMCGTPADQILIGFHRGKHEVYRVYHRICVSFRNGPWTVVIESLFDSLNNRYKWYTFHEPQLTRGFPVYQLILRGGTPQAESSMKSVGYGVPRCTTNTYAICPSGMLSDGKNRIKINKYIRRNEWNY